MNRAALIRHFMLTAMIVQHPHFFELEFNPSPIKGDLATRRFLVAQTALSAVSPTASRRGVGVASERGNAKANVLKGRHPQVSNLRNGRLGSLHYGITLFLPI